MNREERYRRLNVVILVIYTLVATLTLIHFARLGYTYQAAQACLGLGMLLLLPLLKSRLPVYLTNDVIAIYTVFSFATVIVGSALGGYAIIPYWDKIQHFISGFLITMLGLILFHVLDPHKGPLSPKNTRLALCFAFTFNMAVAAIWEIYEYSLYIFFGVDAVNTLTTGANDTLQDLIVCLLGALITTLANYRCLTKHKTNFFYNTYQHFLAANKYFK